jgi:hypothetical protein
LEGSTKTYLIQTLCWNLKAMCSPANWLLAKKQQVQW